MQLFCQHCSGISFLGGCDLASKLLAMAAEMPSSERPRHRQHRRRKQFNEQKTSRCMAGSDFCLCNGVVAAAKMAATGLGFIESLTCTMQLSNTKIMLIFDLDCSLEALTANSS